jgi:hypothetical protein
VRVACLCSRLVRSQCPQRSVVAWPLAQWAHFLIVGKLSKSQAVLRCRNEILTKKCWHFDVVCSARIYVPLANYRVRLVFKFGVQPFKLNDSPIKSAHFRAGASVLWRYPDLYYLPAKLARSTCYATVVTLSVYLAPWCTRIEAEIKKNSMKVAGI